MTHAFKHEIFFINNSIIIYRFFNEEREYFKVRDIISNTEKSIKKEKVLKIVYSWS
jgi:hypothetical protein